VGCYYDKTVFLGDKKGDGKESTGIQSSEQTKASKTRERSSKEVRQREFACWPFAVAQRTGILKSLPRLRGRDAAKKFIKRKRAGDLLRLFVLCILWFGVLFDFLHRMGYLCSLFRSLSFSRCYFRVEAGCHGGSAVYENPSYFVFFVCLCVPVFSLRLRAPGKTLVPPAPLLPAIAYFLLRLAATSLGRSQPVTRFPSSAPLVCGVLLSYVAS